MTDSYRDDEAPVPRRSTLKERELLRLKARFEHWRTGFSSAGFEEDEAIERVNEALDELIELQGPENA